MSTWAVSGARPSPAYLGSWLGLGLGLGLGSGLGLGLGLGLRLANPNPNRNSNPHPHPHPHLQRRAEERHRVLAVAHDPLGRVRTVPAHAQLLLVGAHLP